MSSPAFTKLATTAASTKRATMTSGKRGTAATHLSSVYVMPLYPVDPDLRKRLEIDTPHELLQTFADGSLDIVEGDVLVVSGADYPIRSAAEWPFGTTTRRVLVVEDLKR